MMTEHADKFQFVGLIYPAKPLKYAKMASPPGCHFYIFTLGKYCSAKSTFST
jgi:hypothetical protein